MHTYLLSNIAMAVIAWFSLLIKKPFTSQYASLNLPVELTYSQDFKIINYLLTFIWATLLSLMAIPALTNNTSSIMGIDFRTVATIFIILIGIIITVKLPEWLISHNLKKRFAINIKSLYYKSKKTFMSTDSDIGNITNKPGKAVPTIIIGAGPIGLTIALLLQQHGVSTVIIEKHSGTSKHPKARHVSARSMEIFRRLGLEKAIYQSSLSPSQNGFGWFKRLTEAPIAKVSSREHYENISPCTPANITQPNLEKILLDNYQNRGGQVLFSHKVEKIAQNDNKVQLIVRELSTKNTKIYESQYCIAADGAKSSIRKVLKISLIGKAELVSNFSVYCEIDLNAILKKEDLFNTAFIIPEEGPSPLVVSVDGNKQWVFIFPTPGLSHQAARKIFTDDYCKNKIQSIVGSNSINIKFLNKQPWSIGTQVASQFSTGRIFLAGDSIHQFTPTGGMGMNTGIGDADNLAWKIAFALQGKASKKILHTYEIERLPIILNNLQWSIKNLKRIADIQRKIDLKNQTREDIKNLIATQSSHLDRKKIDLAYRYKSKIIAPITHADSDSILPGMRLPHFTVTQNNNYLSSLDLVRKNYLIMAISTSKTIINSFLENKFDIDTAFFGSDKNDFQIDQSSNHQSILIGEDAVILVRPDGHISWKGTINTLSDLDTILTTNLISKGMKNSRETLN